MDLTQITQFITSLGFPIAVCLLCFWYIREQQKSHTAEVLEMTKAVQENTLAIQHLTDLITGGKNE